MKRPILSLFVVVSAAWLTGCASVPANPEDQQATEVANADHSEGLYDGEPDVVFATEFPVESAEEAVIRADQALVSGKMDLALYMYVRAYSLQKDNLYALTRIAEIHESRGNTSLATRAFSAVLREDPTHTGALQGLGLIYLQSRHYDEALALLERAVAEDPALWRANNGIGVIADMRGDHAAAVRAFDAALQTRPDDAALLNNRGYSYYLDGKLPEAARDFTSAAGKGSERAWLNLGLVMARQRQYEQAVATLQRVVDPEVAYNDVGYVAMRLGDMDVARTFFEKAIQLSPRYFEAAQQNLAQLTPGQDGLHEAGAISVVLQESR